jgi:hypothetical protein
MAIAKGGSWYIVIAKGGRCMVIVKGGRFMGCKWGIYDKIYGLSKK